MKSVLQAILKDNPCIHTYADLAIKIGDVMDILVEELNRQREAEGGERLGDTTIVSRVEDAAGRDLAMQVDEAIAEAAYLNTQAAFALGWYSREHPEWLVFARPDDWPNDS